MSASEGTLSPGSSAAPPPSPAPAAAPPVAAPSPAAAPVAPATPAAAGPAEAIVNDAVATATPGAQPSEPAKPKSIAEAQEIYHRRIAAMQEEGTQPEATPGEAQPTPEPVTPLETQPEAAEEPEPVVEPAEAAPVEEATVPAETEDTDYKEQFRTAEEVEALYNRKLSKKERADIAQREAHRAELAKDRDAIGGDLGVKLATTINAALLTDCPFDETTQSAQAEAWYEDQVDAICDQFVLPENAGAEKLFDHFGKRLVNLQLQEAMCGSCHADGNKPNPKCEEHIAMGREFGGNMIAEEWGKTPDGKAFDFRGMKPIELADLLMRAAMVVDVDEDGNEEPLVNIEFLKTELEGKAKSKPFPEMLALQKENEELRAKTQSESEVARTEQQRQRESDKAIYNTQAKGAVSRAIMAEVTPLAVRANWAAVEGEEGPQVEPKKVLGRLVAADVNSYLMASTEYAAVQKMIDEKTAFDPTTGRMTPRFELKLKPLKTMAKARFNETQRILASQFKFAATTSRNAQLVKKNGGQVGTQPTEAPPLAVAPKPPTDRPPTYEEQMAEVKRKYREEVARTQAQVGVR